jgi:tRNA(Ile)-lysidine synthase
VVLLERVRHFARRHNLWRPETRVIAAVSGGSDSVALLLLLHDLHTRGELILDAVAHVNHTIRGEAADEDEAFCGALARSRGVAFERVRIDVPARARRERVSIEVAARDARREFFAEVASRRAASCVATAHTADDQAETVMLHMVRGAGLRGLGGIAPARDGRVRPLLTCSRAQLQAELISRGQVWQEDATNADLVNPRNRVRHELLPYLERHFNPSARQALCRLADLARADDAALGDDAAAAFLRVVEWDGPAARLDTATLAALPDAIARRVVQQALEIVGDEAYGAADVEVVRAVTAGDFSAGEVAGVRVERSGHAIVLTERGVPASPAAAFRVVLPIPGAVQRPDAGWTLEATAPQPLEPGRRPVTSTDEVEIEAAGLGPGLVVRSRRPGDRLRPLGLSGQKKLQDVFVDRKVDRRDRDRVPIVTDTAGRIVWVAGHVLGDDFRVTDRTNAVITLKLRRGITE